MNKRRELTELDIDEVSLVDLPANQIPFMIIKSANKQETIKVSAKFTELLKTFFGTDKLEFAKNSTVEMQEEAIEKSLETITKFGEMIPHQLSGSIKDLAKSAVELLLSGTANMENIKAEMAKGGVYVSNAKAEEILSVISAVEGLKVLVPEEMLKKAADDAELSPAEKRMSAEIAELTKAMKTFAGKDDDEDEDGDDDDASLAKRIDALEKGGATKKSLDDTDDTNGETKKKDDADDDDKKKDDKKSVYDWKFAEHFKDDDDNK